ncbi:MAG: hypothetical protein M1431_06385 [Candidatus Thermoplasmatota archaeon]|nr:hypothetical protein [Candidatus Thermoplasmatota archaeon]
MKNELELTGLIGSTPIGIMAALGILRIVSHNGWHNDVRLHWKLYDDWVAVLSAENDLSEDQLLLTILSHRDDEKKTVFEYDDVRMKPDEFSRISLKILEDSSYFFRAKADFWAAFGSEMAVDRSQGLVKPTDFYMSTGKQKFLNKIRATMNTITLDKIREAIFGPWNYSDDHASAMGWDPVTYRIHAFRKQEPSTDQSPLCEAAAEWLAYESLPFFPVLTDEVKRLTSENKPGEKMRNHTSLKNEYKRITSGFSGPSFTWPIWVRPADTDTVRTLLLSKEVFEESMRERLRSRGVVAIYSSSRHEFSKGYGTFLPGELVWT